MGRCFLGIHFAPGEIRALALRKTFGWLSWDGFWQGKAASDEEAGSFLQAICREIDCPNLKVVVGLSRQEVVYREFTLPPLKKSAIPGAVGLQLVERTPFELGQFKFAYRLEKVSAGWQAEALAVSNGTLDRYTALLEEAGFAEIAFVPAAHALALLAGRGDYLVGLPGETLQLGLADSWWSREISPDPEDSRQLELQKTLQFLEGQRGRKPQVLLAGEGGWRPLLAGELLEPPQFLAGALAYAGAKGKTVTFRSGEEEERGFFAEPLAAVFLSLWLILALFASFFSLKLREAEEVQLAQRHVPQAGESQELDKAAKELGKLLNQPPQLHLSVLRQLASAPEGEDEYLSLTVTEGEVKELVARSPKATDFIKRLKGGPLASLTLTGPIVESNGKEQFTLTGKVERENEN